LAKSEKALYWLLLIVILLFMGLGLAHRGPLAALRGLVLLQQHPARLINDFTVVGGIGAALLNAALGGAFALGLVRVTSVRLSGPTIAAIFTVMGFSLFGKTVLNMAPIVLGVYIAGFLVQKPFKNNIMIALFGTALGPLVSFLAFETGFSTTQGVVIGIAGGTAAGLFLPALARAMLRLHEGYNLYNVGLTAGFFGLFSTAVLRGFQHDLPIQVIWNDQFSLVLSALVPLLSLLFIVWGLAMAGVGPALKGWRSIQRLPGRLPSDFMEIISPGAALLNAGLLGLAGSLLVLAVDGDFNGPTIGGLMTVMGFALFGKNLRNTWPVVVGVLGATLVYGKAPNAPGPLLALLFGTTLAPLAGEFGPLVGIVAGFLHLSLVEQTAAWHGGLDLYNNGFAAGLVATFLFAMIEWIRSNKPEKRA